MWTIFLIKERGIAWVILGSSSLPNKEQIITLSLYEAMIEPIEHIMGKVGISPSKEHLASSQYTILTLRIGKRRMIVPRNIVILA